MNTIIKRTRMIRRKWRIVAQVLLLFISTNCITADCIKEIQYRVLEEKIQALEAGVDINALNVIDLLQGKSAIHFSTVSICIGQDGYLTKTTTFNYGANSFYPNRIYQTIETSTGIEAYDEEGRLITSIPNDAAEIADIPGIGIPLTATEITAFGSIPDFQSLIPAFQAEYTSFGDTYWNVGTKYFFNSLLSQTVVAPDDLYYLSSEFDEKGKILGMHLETFSNKNGFIIPQFKIDNSYSDLSDGSQMQTSFRDTYLDYSIIEQGVIVLANALSEHPNYNKLPEPEKTTRQTSFSSFKVPGRLTPEVSIFPNPATDQLQIDLNGLWKGTSCTWALTTLGGAKVKTGEKAAEEEQIILAVSELAPGMYFFKMEHAHAMVSKKIIISN